MYDLFFLIFSFPVTKTRIGVIQQVTRAQHLPIKLPDAGETTSENKAAKVAKKMEFTSINGININHLYG
ncbi:hypothetical protein [Alkaliflexus imshenetskii]|uniref:hypothetical protein n=1 Tax=Alkaliflexus imshenetskii TaxID=286730 RepID=UPI001F3991FB|nr:hypothetical protein [Alkaliflexus imshenetskii]